MVFIIHYIYLSECAFQKIISVIQDCLFTKGLSFSPCHEKCVLYINHFFGMKAKVLGKVLFPICLFEMFYEV